MITALMTGLGIGLAFWIITIPTVMLLVKRGTTNDELNKKSLDLLAERNQIDKDIKAALWCIADRYTENSQLDTLANRVEKLKDNK